MKCLVCKKERPHYWFKVRGKNSDICELCLMSIEEVQRIAQKMAREVKE